MPLRVMSIAERLEKAHTASLRAHLLDRGGIHHLELKFQEWAVNASESISGKGFIKFLQYLHNEAFKNGMQEAIRIIQDPYDR